MKFFFLTWPLLYCLKFSYQDIPNDTCEENKPNKYLKYKTFPNSNETWAIFSQFSLFSDLNPSQNCPFFYNITSYLEFRPSSLCLLDFSFDLKKLFNKRQIDSIFSFCMNGLKGLDIHTKPSVISGKFLKKQTYLQIFVSYLDFYSNGNRIDASNDCNLNTFNNEMNFLNTFYGVSFENVVYPKVFCPLVFKNTIITRLDFSDITNSFIKKNRLNFHSLNLTQVSNVMTRSIKEVFLSLNYEILGEKILPISLFSSIIFLGIHGILQGIREQTFKEFSAIKNIDFPLNNFRSFFQSGQEWMEFLNKDVNYLNMTPIDFEKVILLRFIYIERVSFDQIYEYPNEDICLFEKFPHQRLVFPLIFPGKQLKCTCTLKWLQSYSHLYNDRIENKYNYSLNYDMSNKLSTFIFCKNDSLECDFDQIFKSCLVAEKLYVDSFLKQINDTDVLFVIKWLQFILLTLLQPLFCIIGLINNLINILVIENKTKKKEFNQAMYRFIEINSIFNILYCSIRILNLINTCIFNKSGIFCSSIYENESSQYFKIIVIHFLGNTMKLSSNLSYLLFALSRLILITFEKANKAERKHKKLVYGIYFSIIIFVCCLLSLFKLFQYRINDALVVQKDFPYEIRDELYCSVNGNQINFECGLFNGFKIANTILNDVLLLILNLIIDIVLLRNFHKHMDKKLRHIFDINHRQKIEKSKKKINRMIFFNTLLYVFSHLPEFVTTLMLIVYADRILNFCQNNFSCDLINEEAECFSLISIVCQFYVLRIFDKNFKLSFLDLKYRFVSVFVKRRDHQNVISVDTIELKNLAKLIGNGLID